MAKGRKSISNELKVLRGTDQPSRMVKQVSMSKMESIPRSGLKGGAKKIFEMVTYELINKNLLEYVGVDLIVAYAREMSLYNEMTKEVEAEGYIVEVVTKFGVNKIINPKRKIAEAALVNAKGIASEFGFTPASRGKISGMITSNEDENDFTEFKEEK